MYRPESSYKISITDNPESGDFSVWFDKEPEALVAYLFGAIGLKQTKKDQREFRAYGEVEKSFAELMQRSLLLGEYPTIIPYKPSRLKGLEGIEADDFSIATFKYTDIFNQKQTQAILIYERYKTKREGFAGVLAKTLFNVGKEGFSVSKRINRTRAKELLAKNFVQTKIKEPFGFYDDSISQLAANSDSSKSTIASEEKSQDKEPNETGDENTKSLSSDTPSKVITRIAGSHVKDVAPTAVTHVMDVTPHIESPVDSEMEREALHVVDVTPHEVTHNKDVLPQEETPTKSSESAAGKKVKNGEQFQHSQFDEKQTKINYKLLEKLLPDLIPQLERGVNYAESLSNNSDFQKVIFKVTDEMENDLLDISFELVPKKNSSFHHHQLTIRLNLKKKECLMTEWVTKKDRQTKKRNIPTFGLASLLNKLLSQEHLFALSEEELSQEATLESQQNKSDLAAIKQIKLSKSQSDQDSQIHCASWSEANEWLKKQFLEPKKTLSIRFTIVWQNAMLIAGNFELFGEQFHPSYEPELLQKVAIRYFLKDHYKKQLRFAGKSIENDHTIIIERKVSDLNYLNQLDLGSLKDRHIQDYQPKIPALYVEVVTKTILAENKYESIRKFERANEFLELLKSNGEGEEQLELIAAWRDGTRLSTKIKIRSIPKQVTSNFWKMLLKSKTSISEVNSYQFDDNEPLLFDHEINFKAPEFYYSSLERSYWHESDTERKEKLFFSGYSYHKKHLAKTIQEYLSSLGEEDENEIITQAEKSLRQQKVLQFILEYKKLKDNDENLQLAQITQLLTEASKKGVVSSKTALGGLLKKFQNEGTMVSLPKTRKQRLKNANKPRKEKESKRIELNRKIETLLKENGTDRLKYSEKELELLGTYSGYGGSKLSEVNKGLLYEYYTPDEIIKFMWGFAIKHGYNSGAVLEPSCGIGKFLEYAPKNSRIEAYEINRFSAQIAQLLYPHASIHHKSFEQLFFNGNIYLKGNFRTEPFDLVIGNPPYGSFSGKFAGMGEKKRTKAFTYDQYFLTRGIDLLVSGGLLVFVIPQSFLDNSSKYIPLKQNLASKAEFLEARRLPHGIFQHTEVGTDIVVFRKK